MMSASGKIDLVRSEYIRSRNFSQRSERGVSKPSTRKCLSPSVVSSRRSSGIFRDSITTSWPRLTNSGASVNQTFSTPPPIVGGTGKNAPRTTVIFIGRSASRLRSARGNRPRGRFRTVARNSVVHFVESFHVLPVPCRSNVGADELFRRDRPIQRNRRDRPRSHAKCLPDSKLKPEH